MNNMIILDYHGLFIYINIGYLGFYHDVNILHYDIWMFIGIGINTSPMVTIWIPIERLGYMGEKMFIMRRILDRVTIASTKC